MVRNKCICEFQFLYNKSGENFENDNTYLILNKRDDPSMVNSC